MLGTNITSISWPGCGEIDVMENNGKNPGRVAASLHSGSDATETYDFLDGSTVTNFHAYTVDWTTNAILFYVDGHLFERVTSWSSSKGAYPFPFDQPFFLIMNMAVGGNYLGNPSSSTIDAGTQFPGEMLVDYVRLYRLTEPFKMSLYKSNSEVLISWPTNIVSRLQGQQNIAGASVNWQTVDSTNNQARILPVDECSFFRLVTP
jgi:beta-glucanase (GH16 family)